MEQNGDGTRDERQASITTTKYPRKYCKKLIFIFTSWLSNQHVWRELATKMPAAWGIAIHSCGSSRDEKKNAATHDEIFIFTLHELHKYSIRSKVCLCTSKVTSCVNNGFARNVHLTARIVIELEKTRLMWQLIGSIRFIEPPNNVWKFNVVETWRTHKHWYKLFKQRRP